MKNPFPERDEVSVRLKHIKSPFGGVVGGLFNSKRMLINSSNPV
jgi:hypothetical protein